MEVLLKRFPSVLAASILTVSSISTFCTPAFAQDAADLEMAQFQFSGVVNSDNVYIRSGASENDYPVLKLAKGDTVVAVGNKFDWVKVLPPEGSYCLVGKAWVDKRGDGSVGRVRDDASNVNVRIASNINSAMITKVAMQLKGGDDVKILGDQDEYFKIAPPAGTFMFVHKKFIDPVKRVEVINNNGNLEVKPVEGAIAGNGGTTKPAESVAGTNTGTTVVPPPTGNTGSSNTIASNTGTTPPPTTSPAQAEVTAAEAEYDALEVKFEEVTKLPLEQQPVDELLAGYTKIVSEKKIPESMLRIAELRLKGLKVRKDALAQYLETKRLRDELAIKTKPLEAEGQEIGQRIKDAKVKEFTAVGTLRQSALPYGGRMLYRLTDPVSGRTVVYVNSDDPSVIKMEGLFIGIRGQLTDDPARKIKFIQPKEVEQIDPSQVTKGTVTSTLVPASLLPAAAKSDQ